MTPEQGKAAKGLLSALRKVRDAQMSLYVYDGAVYVCPSEVDVQASDDAIVKLETSGIDCTPIGLHADGGAGV